MSECTECNLCREDCPTYRASLLEFMSPLGRLRIIKSCNLPPKDVIYTCVQCRSCEISCPISFRIWEEIESVRKKIGIYDSKIYFKKRDVKISGKGKYAYFPGCIMINEYKSIAERTYNLLKRKMKIAFIEGCCGALDNILGREFDNSYYDFLGKFEEVYSSCPTCVFTLRKKGINANHVVELYARKKVKSNIFKAYYHDPCVLSRHLKIIDEIREIIRINEVEYSGKRTLCCGMGGGVGLIYSGISRKMGKIRAMDFLSVGTDFIVTSCPSCMFSLSRYLKVLDISEVISWR